MLLLHLLHPLLLAVGRSHAAAMLLTLRPAARHGCMPVQEAVAAASCSTLAAPQPHAAAAAAPWPATARGTAASLFAAAVTQQLSIGEHRARDKSGRRN